MQQATEQKINALNKEREAAMNAQRNTLQNQHSTEMENMRKQQNQLTAERNNQIQQYQQMQNNLNQQIQQAHAQIIQLQQRPRKYILFFGLMLIACMSACTYFEKFDSFISACSTHSWLSVNFNL